MTIQITFWEIALIIIAIAFVFLVAALVRFFNNLRGVLVKTEDSLTKINGVIDENKDDIQKLINNSTGITSDIQAVTKSLNTITGVVKKLPGMMKKK